MDSDSFQQEEAKYEAPGIIFQHPDASFKFNPDNDGDLLEARIEAKLDGDAVENIVFSEDCMKAYVELKNKEGMPSQIRYNS